MTGRLAADRRPYTVRYQGPLGVRNADTDRAGALAFLTAHGAPRPSRLIAEAEAAGMAEDTATDGGLLYVDTEPDDTDDTES